ncbi:MAG: response regulator [Thermodesulfovibrionales bacterium]
MRKPRVIIFDDESMLLELMEFYFDRWGFEVFSFQTPIVCLFNGSSGSCESLAPCADLVISDFQMPQMTGIELFQLQARKGCRIDNKMKAIMSGHADGELLKQCKDLGYKFFQKPFDYSELYAWVSECEKYFDLSKPLVGKKPSKRYDFIQDIEYCLNASRPNEKLIGFTVNKSTDGLGLRVFNPLLAGQEITILNGLEATNLNGTVIWCNQVGESAYRAGLRLKG